MDAISRVWRFFAAALCFFSFGAGGLLLNFVIFPAVNLLTGDEERRQMIAQAIIRRSFRFFVGMMQVLGAMNLKVEGTEILEEDAGCIVVANHPTLIDYVLLAALLPRCVCIVKHAMWRNPFARGAISAAGYIDNSDTSDMLANCASVLQSGHVLLIFPEGTRTSPGKDLQLKRGAAQVAVRARADVRIVQISCKPPYLNKQEKWYRVPRQKPFFLVRVMEKVSINKFVEDAPSDAAAARKLNEYLTKALLPKTV